MRAVYVPTRVVPAGLAKLEAAAPATGGGGTLTCYPVGGRVRHQIRLTAGQLRWVVRQWARAVLAGEGRVRVGDWVTASPPPQPLPPAPTSAAAPLRGGRRRAGSG
jgi:hypothetical protein